MIGSREDMSFNWYISSIWKLFFSNPQLLNSVLRFADPHHCLLTNLVVCGFYPRFLLAYLLLIVGNQSALIIAVSDLLDVQVLYFVTT